MNAVTARFVGLSQRRRINSAGEPRAVRPGAHLPTYDVRLPNRSPRDDKPLPATGACL